MDGSAGGGGGKRTVWDLLRMFEQPTLDSSVYGGLLSRLGCRYRGCCYRVRVSGLAISVWQDLASSAF